VGSNFKLATTGAVSLRKQTETADGDDCRSSRFPESGSGRAASQRRGGDGHRSVRPESNCAEFGRFNSRTRSGKADRVAELSQPVAHHAVMPGRQLTSPDRLRLTLRDRMGVGVGVRTDAVPFALRAFAPGPIGTAMSIRDMMVLAAQDRMQSIAEQARCRVQRQQQENDQSLIEKRHPITGHHRTGPTGEESGNGQDVLSTVSGQSGESSQQFQFLPVSVKTGAASARLVRQAFQPDCATLACGE